MSGIYTREEIERTLNDQDTICRSLVEATLILPDADLIKLYSILDDYRVRLKETFGIGE